MDKSIINLTTALAVALGLSLALLTAPVSAKGPRASVSSATTCDLEFRNDGAFLLITTNLVNKSSGITVTELRDGSKIDSTTKAKTARGNAYEVWETMDIVPAPAPIPLTFTAEFDLCNSDGSVRDRVLDSRELNGKATVRYGISGGVGETRMVTNRCTDPDPNDGVDQGGGIRVADVIGDIEAYCLLLPLPPP